MRLDPEYVLSAEAVEALEGLRPEPAGAAVIPDGELLHLILQDLSPEETDRIARLATGSIRSRKRLVELWQESRRLYDLPVASWPSGAFLDSVRAALLGPIQVGAYPAHVRTWLASMGRNLRTTLSAPRFAPMRGGEAGLFAQLSADGTLQVTVTPVKDSRARLELVDPLGGRLPLSEQLVEGKFVVEGFGALVDLAEGPLPNSLFHVVWGEAGSQARPEALWAEGEDGEVVALELTEAPRVLGGVLLLRVRIPDIDFYRDRRLVLCLPLGNGEVTLGAWPIAGMTEETTLEAALPDVPDGVLPFGSILRARLESAEGR